MSNRIARIACVLAAALAAGGPAFAQNPFGDLQNNYSAEQARDAQRSGQVNITSQQARMIALSQYPGSDYLDLVLSGGDRPVYTVRLKTADGRRVEVRVDARTGAVLRDRR